MKVKFSDVNIPLLKKKGLTCVDMHVHTNYSDAMITPEQAIKKAAKLGCGIGIMDHNKIGASLKVVKNKKGVLVIPGLEINTAQKKDVLVYFYNVSEMKEFHKKYVKPKLPVCLQTSKVNFDEIIEITKDYNCIVGAAHPCASLHKNLKKFGEVHNIKPVTSKMCFFEVLNANLFRKNNLEAIAWAKKENKAFTSGSDAHTVDTIGKAVTCANADNVDDFLDEILAKRNSVVGTETSCFRKSLAVMAIIEKNIETLGNLLR
ncbi:PHP domain-containing protein [Candidatus Woesearchaeota archaeon]|nr:PHP domain-containing protein [Candidatus Woesearchaeota archaeon]